MKLTSVKGTCDYLPKETKIRDYIQDKILSVYSSRGFERIYTPILEDIENLEHSDGGDNLALIFKIMKRGERLQSAMESGCSLCDMGLRYDLTLPLSRFYAQHKASLPSPFKVIQMGRVYRAERPQKGRNREFVQCDIDIIGSNSRDCEIELIDTTSQALIELGIKDFTVAINDRALLRKVLSCLEFSEEDFDSVCITFDKLDKIGLDGVSDELISKGFDKNIVSHFVDFLSKMPRDLSLLSEMIGACDEIDGIKYIIDCVKELSCGVYDIVFDLSLVRGQGYYTGTIYEIRSNSYHCSIAGGGRYDGLVGKFCGEEVPAVGFSIGFERIYDMLRDNIDESSFSKERLAIIYDEGEFLAAIKMSKELSKTYNTTLCMKLKKLGKQLSKLEESGFSYYAFCDGEIKKLEKLC